MVVRSWKAGPGLGILLYSTGVFFFALNDALGKVLIKDFSSPQLLMLRGIGAAIFLVPLVWRHRPELWPRDQLGWNVFRLACMTVDSYGFYLASRYLPLADVMTFYVAAPLIITALSAVLLGERVGLYRWSAVAVGFVGVLIALNPTSAVFTPASFIALAGALAFSLSVTTTRKLRQTPWLSLVVRQFVVSSLIGGLASPIGWVTPSFLDLVLTAVLGFTAVFCFICITKSLAMADASIVSPFQYASIIWAAILGWIFWGDIPTTATVVGVCIIVASGLAVWWREMVRIAPVTADAVPIP